MAEAEETEEVTGPRSQMWKHEAMVEWINEQKEVDLDTLSAAEIIAYAFALRVPWRRSETYQTLVAEHAETAEAEREERAAARAAEKERKAAEKAAAKEAEEAEKEEPKKAVSKATKAPAKAASKATKATKASKAASSTDDSPFD